LKLSAEGEKSPTDEYLELVQRWKDRASFAGRSLTEKYLAGRFALVCDLHVSVSSAHLDEGATIGDSRQFVNHKRFARLVFAADIPNALDVHLGEEQFVLVKNVETVKLPNGMPVPSQVRLYDVKNEVADSGGSLMFKSAVDGIFHTFPGVANRKSGMLASLPSGGELNVAGRVVESRSQVMDSVSGDAHQPLRHTFKRDDAEAIVASVSIVLDGDIVRESALVGRQLTVEFSDVFFGPFNL
jgi:hypothetical protein